MKKLSLRYIKKENDVNKLIRQQKREKNKAYVLFVSPWDAWSDTLTEKLTSLYPDSDDGIPVYILNSWDVPHAFLIYKTTKLPHLVRLGRGRPYSVDYLPFVYKELGL